MLPLVLPIASPALDSDRRQLILTFLGGSCLLAMVRHCCYCSRSLENNPSLQLCKKLSKEQRKVLLTSFEKWNDEELDLLLDKYDPARSKTPLY